MTANIAACIISEHVTEPADRRMSTFINDGAMTVDRRVSRSTNHAVHYFKPACLCVGLRLNCVYIQVVVLWTAAHCSLLFYADVRQEYAASIFRVYGHFNPKNGGKLHCWTEISSDFGWLFCFADWIVLMNCEKR